MLRLRGLLSDRVRAAFAAANEMAGAFLSPAAVAIVSAMIAVLAAMYIAGSNGFRERVDRIGFVDVAMVMSESDAGKAINAQVTPKQQALEAEAQNKLKEFKQRQAGIAARRASMSAAEADQQGKALRQQIDEWNATARKRNAELNKAVAPALQMVQQALREQVAAIAAANGIDTVLPAGQAVYAAKKLDLTAETIRRLNIVLPKVEITFDQTK